MRHLIATVAGVCLVMLAGCREQPTSPASVTSAAGDDDDATDCPCGPDCAGNCGCGHPACIAKGDAATPPVGPSQGSSSDPASDPVGTDTATTTGG